ncbi:MAG: Zinc transporter ZupT [Chloroflexi bacterium ADurb.Bin180]|nr:MAG: Zinc transporter ZupT [Chloroflexi bacterium ADurb.Bin180]HOU24694.1 ZIP family metal transporter [Anaerolineae bacterium]HQJ52102.1 ZIP family metal transporter [Anaerolineae bacterium]
MTVLNAVALSLIAGLATGLGGFAVALLGKMDMKVYDSLLGFSAGVMTAVATLGLVQEAVSVGSLLVSLLGIASGAALLFLMDRFLPHEHEQLPFECSDHVAYRRGLLLLTAMTLHNLPEGLAVGTGYASSARLGLLLALAIALHNIPEGVAIAGPFRACGMPRRQYLLWAAGSGLAEPAAALVGALAVAIFRPMLPFALAFAGGAMLYVVSDELIPESHSHGFEHQATAGFLLGFMLLVTLTRLFV